VGAVAVDASQLYWANSTDFWPGNGAIWRANLDGSNPQAIVYGQNNPVGMAVDASHLYWANDPDGTINRANPDGSGPHTIIGGQGRRPPRSECRRLVVRHLAVMWSACPTRKHT
jgi:sugar lactone lactonase YvrE